MKPLKWTIIVFCLLTSLSASAGWHLINPMPHGRYGHGASLGSDGNIYVMGGMVFGVGENNRIAGRFDDGRYSNLIYDIKKDEWRYLEPVPGWVITKKTTFMAFLPEMGGWRYANKIEDTRNEYKVLNTKTKKNKLSK